MYGHERSLVQRYKSRPFVLLGVNTDPDVATLRRVQEQHQISWRSWFDGPHGPISQAWKITGYPSIFLIDAKGMIRRKYEGAPGAEELDGEIEKLVAEAEK